MSEIEKLRAVIDLIRDVSKAEKAGCKFSDYGTISHDLIGQQPYAILELAERLDALEAAEAQPVATDSPPEPFRVTGPGLYRMAKGELVSICEVEGREAGWRWRDKAGRQWDDAGVRFFGSDTSEYLVEGPLAEEKESAGLTGFAGVQGSRLIYFNTSQSAFEHGWESVIDLSRITKDQFVKPDNNSEPALTRQRRKVWIALFENGDARGYNYDPTEIFSRSSWHPQAIVTRVIEFTPGEGLGRSP